MRKSIKYTGNNANELSSTLPWSNTMTCAVKITLAYIYKAHITHRLLYYYSVDLKISLQVIRSED